MRCYPLSGVVDGDLEGRGYLFTYHFVRRTEYAFRFLERVFYQLTPIADEALIDADFSTLKYFGVDDLTIRSFAEPRYEDRAALGFIPELVADLWPHCSANQSPEVTRAIAGFRFVFCRCYTH